MTVVCVGTDRSTGDSLGPLVGSILRWADFPGGVLGHLDSPIHAENLQSVIPLLNSVTGSIVAVDACLGHRSEVGSVAVRAGPLRPGLGVRKKLPPVGDLHIAGIVNVGGFMEYMVLQNTRLGTVMAMARAIARGVTLVQRILDGDIEPGQISPPLSAESGRMPKSQASF